MKNQAKGHLLSWAGTLMLVLLAGTGCAKKISYLELPIDDRHKNVKGIEALFLDHLDRHPEDWTKMLRILSEADEALNSHRLITRRGVTRWIDRQMRKERLDPGKIPGFLLLRSVYLEGWDSEFLNFVDEQEREMLNDFMTGIMGALHNCRSCAGTRGHGGDHH